MHYIKAQYYEKMHKSIHKFFITRRAEAEQLPRRLITAVGNGGWQRPVAPRAAPRAPRRCAITPPGGWRRRGRWVSPQGVLLGALIHR